MEAKEHITKVIRRMKEDANTFMQFFSSEESYVDTMKNNSLYLGRKNQELIDQIKQQEIHLDNLKNQGSMIVTEAQKEADRILEIARENFAVSVSERAQSSKLKEDAKRELSMARQKAEEMVA